MARNSSPANRSSTKTTIVSVIRHGKRRPSRLRTRRWLAKMPTKNNRHMGVANNIMLKMSGVGVTTAAIIKIIRMA
jgi:hypothetical protein